MSEPFLAEVRIVGFNFPPRGWAFCDGQILPINQNQSLYALLGTTYGGDGRTSFALPDLRGRVPVHAGRNAGRTFGQGQRAGEETHQLTIAETPAHDHELNANNGDTNRSDEPTNHVLGKAAVDVYAPPGTIVGMGTDSVANAGGGQAHENMMPYLVLSFCIALRGLFPSRN